jgi:hypothetical protein
LGQRESGFIRQVTSWKKLISYEIFYEGTRKGWLFNRGDCMDMFDFMVQSSGNLNLYVKGELPYRWCNGCVVDCGFEPRSGQTKYYKIGMCCFSAKHAALRRNRKDWSSRNQIMWPIGATCLSGDCFDEKIQLSALV